MSRTTYRFGASAISVAVIAALIAAWGVAPAQAAFPGTNGKIAFESNRDGNYEIYTMNSDGTNPTNLTNNPAGDFEPTFSPDGSKIAFLSYRDGGNTEIYTMNADGTNPTPLTNDPAPEITPAFSPDGSKIAFASYQDGNEDIYVMNSDGTNPIRLTNDPADDYEPTFSPDGSKIAFRSDRRDANGDVYYEIYVMNADGTNPTPLTDINDATDNTSPAFSPDGTKIAFSSNRSRTGNMEICVMNADGTNPTTLTDTNGTAASGYPAFSPDGSKIAFRRYYFQDDTSEIYTMNADGTNPTNLTNNPARDEMPDWQALAAMPTTAPTVTSTVPKANANEVAPTANVKATFSEKMDPDTLSTSTFKLFKVNKDGTTARITPAPVRLSEDGLTARLNPFGSSDTRLAKNTRYKAVVTTGATDVAGNALDQDDARAGNQQKVWYFTTGTT